MTEPDDDKRLQSLANLDILDRPVEERFHRITRLVRRHFRAGISTITIIDRARAFYLAQDPVSRVRENLPEKTLCSRVVEAKDPLIVADLSSEARSPAYQYLVGKLDLHFYAGVPILAPDGHAVGALCVMDHIPRRFSRRDLESLADFASIVEDELVIKRVGMANQALVSQVEKLRIKAFVDPLTNVWNRGAIFDILHREMARADRNEQALSLCMLDLDHFKKVNDTYGHQVGDDVLRETCVRLRAAVRAYDGIGRYGGEEFLIVFPETDSEQASNLAERLRESVGGQEYDLGEKSGAITISLGVTQYKPGEDIKDTLNRADQALYQAKNNGRNRVECLA